MEVLQGENKEISKFDVENQTGKEGVECGFTIAHASQQFFLFFFIKNLFYLQTFSL